MTSSAPTDSLEAVFRIESARIIAGVARIVRDVGIAEEIAQDALVAALESWPEAGAPSNPGAWLMATAERRAIDLVRRKETYAWKLTEVGRTLRDVPPIEPRDADSIDDDLLRLIFVVCHPVLTPDARIALTLRLMGGLTTDEIARAFLVSEPTIAQRIVRAKRSLAEAEIPFEVPYGSDRAARVASVLEVIYLIFNEGYSATTGEDLVRPGLCEDALRLARVLAGLMPAEPEVRGLVALVEFQASRIAARTGPTGEPVLLADQDRSRWNRMFIARGSEALRRAGDGPYSLQAAIAACHAHGNSIRGHRLDGDRRPLRPAHGAGPVPGGGTESSGRHFNVRGTGSGVEDRGCPRRRTSPEELSLAAERARRSARAPRAEGRGVCRIREGGIDDPECPREGVAPGTGVLASILSFGRICAPRATAVDLCHEHTVLLGMNKTTVSFVSPSRTFRMRKGWIRP